MTHAQTAVSSLLAIFSDGDLKLAGRHKQPGSRLPFLVANFAISGQHLSGIRVPIQHCPASKFSKFMVGISLQEPGSRLAKVESAPVGASGVALAGDIGTH